jgi:surfeit locus 1 family protein
MRAAARSMSRTRVFGTVMMLVGVLLFSALGRWQLARGEWKQRLIDAHAETANEPARDLAAITAAHDALPAKADFAASAVDTTLALPMRVEARGHYEPRATVLLDNQIREGIGGAMVLTVFIPAGDARPVLVNRGWLPIGATHTAPEIAPPPHGETTLSGTLVPLPQPGITMGNAAYVPGAPPPLLAYLDLAALRAQLAQPLFDGMLLLDPQYDGGFSRVWTVLPGTMPPERHRGYAVQWFALALAVFITWIILMRRRRATP